VYRGLPATSRHGGSLFTMGALSRYIFRATLGAFLLVLISLTTVIWITQALRDIDVMTSQGQTVLVFVSMTAMVIPQLVMVIAPIALMISGAYVLSKLAGDSEIIVMNAAGMSPRQLFAGFFVVTLVVTALVAVVSSYLSPKSLRELRRMAAEIRADVVANIVQPGRFTQIEQGLTFHIRERRPDGLLLGIFVDDQRNPHEQATFLAEQGEILENNRGTFLVLNTGSVQRHPVGDRDPTIVLFERYAFDLSRFTGGPQALTLSVRERFTWELLSPPPDDPVYAREPGVFRAEFHDRIMAPLYPMAFMVIAFAYLGAPRTTRQSRGMSLVAVISAVSGLRMVGFASTVFGMRNAWALSLQYIALGTAFWLGYMAISRGTIVEPPAFVLNLISAISERWSRRAAAT
jgi:lipopolysaccharide export system permease protein